MHGNFSKKHSREATRHCTAALPRDSTNQAINQSIKPALDQAWSSR